MLLFIVDVGVNCLPRSPRACHLAPRQSFLLAPYLAWLESRASPSRAEGLRSFGTQRPNLNTPPGFADQVGVLHSAARWHPRCDSASYISFPARFANWDNLDFQPPPSRVLPGLRRIQAGPAGLRPGAPLPRK